MDLLTRLWYWETNLSDNQIKKIKKYVNKVYLALGNDKTGITALKKNTPVLK